MVEFKACVFMLMFADIRLHIVEINDYAIVFCTYNYNRKQAAMYERGCVL